MTETTPHHQQMDIDMDMDVDTTPPTPNNTTVTTAVTSPVASSAETSPAIHPMHAPRAKAGPSSNGQKDGQNGEKIGGEKKGLTPLERQRMLLKQKLAAQQPAGFSSPTDNMMTPVSRKLADTKKKTFATAKATSLSTRFGLAGVQAKKSAPGSSLFGEEPKATPGSAGSSAGSSGSALGGAGGARGKEL